MEKLELNIFLSAAEDIEYSQYKVLAILNKYSEALRRSKLYPVFSNLIEIGSSLTQIMNQRNYFKENLPRKLMGFDLNKKKAVYEVSRKLSDRINQVFDFIEWAIPKINDELHEAKTIYEFVDENTKLTEVGISPLYKKEGYFIIKDVLQKRINIYRYEMRVIPAREDRFHTLKTKLVETYQEEEIAPVLNEVKLELARKFSDLPVPATFLFENELDFPFKETIFPVAKRKLMRTIAA